MTRSRRRFFVPFLAFLWITAICPSLRVMAAAQNFTADLSLEPGAVRAETDVIAGKTVRIYATVKNNSNQDLTGTVKFYDEKDGKFIGQDQPISALAHGTDDVFVDWPTKEIGDFPISVRIIPWDEKNDNPDNNKQTVHIYVDVDTDGDGIPNRLDPDDDNDGVPDAQDAFPLDPKESVDTDHDGIGNNADPDDDNDGVPDAQDAFPLNPKEWKDSDGDGVGDNSDAFPLDPKESVDTDHDGLGDNSDPFPNHPRPFVQIQTDSNVVPAGSVITFNGLKSFSKGADIVKYEWDFGKGVESTSVVVDKVFSMPGTYNVKLKVTDSIGDSNMATMTITVIYRWQTFALIGIILLLFLLLLYHLVHSKKVLAKKKKRTYNRKARSTK